jgi:DNA-binding NarL/FixJ family response regulator
VADIRVLIVDDQQPFRRAMSAVVGETDGFVVVGSASSGEEALALAADLRPDLVLMDVHLPGLDGIEATRRLTGSPGAPVVVLLSTYDEDQFELAGCGAASYVAKAAFGPDRLSAAWEEAARRVSD